MTTSNSRAKRAREPCQLLWGRIQWAPRAGESNVQPMSDLIDYEQPLNERVRLFLRLESLFQQTRHSLRGTTIWDTRLAMASLLEILAIFGRADLKTEIIKELERHSIGLTRLEQNPDVDQNLLGEILDDLDVALDRLHGLNGQVAQELRQNEFLTSIRQRSAIPGGTCDFDLPAYHFWLQQPVETRARDLREWLSSFDVFQHAVALILGLIRKSTMATREIAAGGLYQRALDPNTPVQLIRVALPRALPMFAEISAGRHRFTVRFLEQSTPNQRASQVSTDVEFELTCCVI